MRRGNEMGVKWGNKGLVFLPFFDFELETFRDLLINNKLGLQGGLVNVRMFHAFHYDVIIFMKQVDDGCFVIGVF